MVGNLDMMQVWLQAFLQLTSRKYSGTRMGPGLLQSALNLQTSAAAAMPSVLVTSVPGLGKPQYVAAQRTGLSSSMHWAWAWKRAATLAQCTANGYVPNSAYTAAVGARRDTPRMPRRKSLYTCSAGSAHRRLVVSVQQVPPNLAAV